MQRPRPARAPPFRRARTHPRGSCLSRDRPVSRRWTLTTRPAPGRGTLIPAMRKRGCRSDLVDKIPSPFRFSGLADISKAVRSGLAAELIGRVRELGRRCEYRRAAAMMRMGFAAFTFTLVSFRSACPTPFPCQQDSHDPVAHAGFRHLPSSRWPGSPFRCLCSLIPSGEPQRPPPSCAGVFELASRRHEVLSAVVSLNRVRAGCPERHGNSCSRRRSVPSWR